ncbi:hypothetical protein [Kurthia zopfii]|uniref:hypothetical protein n=1 Tax=Kurthia zopfii TaxID=1650 RepID=UPI000F7184EE|nr:hypothetical protein [Kurthia zopfii]VEI06070.1 Uncharacterised protein [Kurthia zopfii]
MNNKQKNYTDGQKYLEDLHIGQNSYNYLSTPNGRTGNRGTTKQKWRITDGIDYPCIVFKPTKNEENEEAKNE